MPISPRSTVCRRRRWFRPYEGTCPPDPRGGQKLEVTNCDLKFDTSLGWSALHAVRLHGTWRRDAVERAAEPARDRRQHRDHACLRSAPSDVALARGAGPQAQRARKEIRLAVPSRLRRDPALDVRASARALGDRIPAPPERRV